MCGLSCLHFLLRREHSTIVEGQRLGIVHIMEGTFLRDIYIYTYKYTNIYKYMYKYMYIYMCVYVCMYVCVFVFYVVWCRVMSCAARGWVVGWLGVVWCGVNGAKVAEQIV